MDQMTEEEQPYYITEYVTSRMFNVYLNREIMEPHKYSKLFDLLSSASPYDIIKIHINSPGGDMHTGSQLITHMQTSQAHIITILESSAMSLAPLILFAGDDIEISEHSIIMFHDYSTGEYGKGNEMVRSANAYCSYYKSMLEKYAKPFLTDKEIKDIVNGQDLYIQDEVEINKRLERLMKHRADEAERLEALEAEPDAE